MADLSAIQRELQRRQGEAAPAAPDDGLLRIEVTPQGTPLPSPTPGGGSGAGTPDREAMIRQILESRRQRQRQQAVEMARQNPFSTEAVPELAPARQAVQTGLETAERRAEDFTQGLLGTVGLGQSPTAARLGIIPPEGQVREGGFPAMARGAGAATGFTAATVAPFLRGATLPAAMTQAAPAARGLPAVAEAARGSLQTMAQTALRAPARFFGAEAGLGAAAGLGGEVAAREFPDQPLARAAGELGGGMVAAGAPAAVRAGVSLSHISPIAIATRSAVRALRSGLRGVQGRPPSAPAPGEPIPGMERATRRTARATADPEATLRAADEADILPEARGQMTVGERAEDIGMLELERAVTESTEQLSRANQERFAAVNRMIRESLDAPPGTGDASPEQMRAYLDELMATDLEIALARAQERLAQLGPSVPRENANRLAREGFERAYKAAKAQENALWDALPRELPVPLESTVATARSRMEQALSNRLAADKRGGVPALAQRWLGRFDPESGDWIPGELGDTATVDELKRLRTDLRRQADKERAKPAPDRERLAAIADLEEAILDDMAKAFPGEDSPFDLARAFSKDLHDRFRKGDVGRILGFTEIGEERILPGMTLEATVGRQGAMAREATDALLRAVERSGDLPAMRGHIEAFLADEFQRAASRAGDFDPTAAAAYLARRQDVLARFPELRRQMEGAIQARRAVLDVERRTDPRVSAAAVMLNAPPGQEMRRLVTAPNPAAATREALALLRRDPTGRAVQGAQKAFTEYLLDRASPPGQLDVQDVPLVSGSRLRAQMLDPRVMAVAKELLTPGQLRRLEQARNTALRMERSRRAAPSAEGIIGDTTGAVASFAEDVLFNKLGLFVAKATGAAPLQTPARAVQFGRELRARGLDPSKKLLIDAVTARDDSLMRAIMTASTDSPRKVREARQRLNAWALEGAREFGVTLTAPDTEDPQQ